MKKVPLILILAMSAASISLTMAQSDFSSPLIGVGVVVTDIQKSLDFYTTVIGMKKVGEFDVDAEFGRSSGLTRGVPFHVDVMKLEESPGANQWKLMSFGKEAGHTRPEYIEDDTGPQYITIMVNSLEPFLQRIKKNKVKMLGDTPIPLPPDQHFVLVQDPDGTFIELIGPLK